MTVSEPVLAAVRALAAVCDPAERLAAIRTLRGLLLAQEHTAVRQLRDGGASWAEVGDVLGVTPDDARLRFDPAGAVTGTEEDLEQLPR